MRHALMLLSVAGLMAAAAPVFAQSTSLLHPNDVFTQMMLERQRIESERAQIQIQMGQVQSDIERDRARRQSDLYRANETTNPDRESLADIITGIEITPEMRAEERELARLRTNDQARREALEKLMEKFMTRPR